MSLPSCLTRNGKPGDALAAVRRFSHTMKLSVLAILLLAFSAAAKDDNTRFITKEIEWTKPLNLADFGGPHIEVFVRSREMTFVSVQTADFTLMVPIARTNIQSVEVNNYTNTATVYGTTSSDLQPTRQTRGVKKERGVPGPGGRNEMYLLFQEPKTGIKVYFLDAISRMNHDTLVVAVPKPAPPPNVPQLFPSAPALPNKPAPSTPIPNKHAEALPISPELFAWYVRLQQERESLDTTNPEAVALFNRHAADYHDALKKARTNQQQQSHVQPK